MFAFVCPAGCPILLPWIIALLQVMEGSGWPRSKHFYLLGKITWACWRSGPLLDWKASMSKRGYDEHNDRSRDRQSWLDEPRETCYQDFGGSSHNISRELLQEPAAFAFESLWSDDSVYILRGPEACDQISVLLLISCWVPFTNVSMAWFLISSKEDDDDENSNS